MRGIHKVCVVLVAAALAAGCGDPVRGMAFDVEGHAVPDHDVPPVDTADSNLRPVRPSGGAVLATVPMETAVQVICQAFGRQEWAQLLGGPVGRQVTPKGDPLCRVAGDRVTLEFRRRGDVLLDFAPKGPVQEIPIAGRRVRVNVSENKPHTGEAAFALTEDAEQLGARSSPGRYRVVSIRFSAGEKARHDQSDTFTRVITGVLEKLVPILTRDDTPMPDLDDKGGPRFTPTPVQPAGAILDTSVLLQGLQLCTAGLQLTGQDPQAVALELNYMGWCTIRPPEGQGTYVTMYLSDSGGDAAPAAPVAGRKAWARNADSVAIQLRDDVPLWLTVSMRGDPRPFAEKLVPVLV